MRLTQLILGTALLLGFSPAVANAAPDVLQYRLYAGGLRALDAQLTLEESAGRYTVNLTSSTASSFKLVAPWSGSFDARGWMLGERRQPETFASVSKTSEKTKTKDYTYNKAGDLTSFKWVEAGKDKTPNPLPPELVPNGVTDVLSATLERVDALNKTGSCKGSSVIFDGDRNFTLAFKDAGTEQLLLTKYNPYQGESVACTFEMQPGKGKWRKKLRGWLMLQEQNRELGGMPTVWFAKLGRSYVPVKVQVKTNYGTLLLHLNAYQGADGVQLAVKKDK